MAKAKSSTPKAPKAKRTPGKAGMVPQIGSKAPKAAPATDAKPSTDAVALPQEANAVKAPLLTEAEALAAAKAAFGDHIVAVTQTGVKGQATRVKIKCTDKQEVRGVSICDGTREIAIQDAFQVKRCASCQARIERKKRQAKRSLKQKAERAAARDAKAKAPA